MSDVIRTACSEFVESLKAHRRQLLNALLEAADEIAAERDSIDGNSDWRSFEYPCWDERANWTLGEWEALDDEAEEYVAPANFVDGFDYITYLASDVMGWLASNGGRSAVDRLLGSLESDLPSQLIKNAEQAIDWKPELFSVLRDAVQAALDPLFQHMAKGDGDQCFQFRGHSLSEDEFWPMLTSEMSAEIEVRLDALVNQSWVAFVPVEQAFASFSEWTELPLFPFKLLNVIDELDEDVVTTNDETDEERGEQLEEETVDEMGEEDGGKNQFVASFVAALDRHVVRVMDTKEVDYSYSQLAEQLRDKTKGLIPGHPLLVVNCGGGSAAEGARFLRRTLARSMHFLSFCQLTYVVLASIHADDSSATSTRSPRSIDVWLRSFDREARVDELVDQLDAAGAIGYGRHFSGKADLDQGTGPMDLQLGLGYGEAVDAIAPILREVPYIALTMKRETGGHARLWNILVRPAEAAHSINMQEYGQQLQNLPRRFETGEEPQYNPKRFLEIWSDYIVPILTLKQRQYANRMHGRILSAMESAISLVARCRHRDPGELLLHAIIATETLLNPFDMRQESTSKRFQKFGTALTGIRQSELEMLYLARNKIVHGSDLYGGADVLKARTTAFLLFLGCLKAVTNWATNQVHRKFQCDKQAFEQFYHEATNPGGKS